MRILALLAILTICSYASLSVQSYEESQENSSLSMPRIRFIKSIILLLVSGILASCSLFDYNKCNEPDRFYGYEVHFKTYDSEKYFNIDSSRYSIFRFSFYEDESFSYLRIYYQNTTEGIVIQDTTLKLNGKFKISEDSGFPWYVLEMDTDYIYEKKEKDTLDNIVHFTEFSKDKFTGFQYSYLTNKAEIFINTTSNGTFFYKDNLSNTDKTDSCFSLYVKSAVTGIDASCAYEYKGCYWMLSRYRTFCLKQPEETPEQNSKGDVL